VELESDSVSYNFTNKYTNLKSSKDPMTGEMVTNRSGDEYHSKRYYHGGLSGDEVGLMIQEYLADETEHIKGLINETKNEVVKLQEDLQFRTLNQLKSLETKMNVI
jgi:hypothetical protein